MVRVGFSEELVAAERDFMSLGRMVSTQLERVMRALTTRDLQLAHQVVQEDDVVDEMYLATDARILNLIALQAPVAKDLRLVSALLHSNVHLERIGDLCVNVAKFVSNDHDYPLESPMLTTLKEMGDRAGQMIAAALTAFSQRDVEVAEQLPIMDDVIDRLNRSMLHQLKDDVGEEESYEWAINLFLVARYLERLGDHAVDIGEQTAFLVTGEFREFTDASHPS